MKNSLFKKITLAMVALAVGGIMLTAVLTDLSLNWYFYRYLRNVQEAQNRLIVDTLAHSYGEAASWLEMQRDTMYVGSITNTQIRVYDTQGVLIADSLSAMTHVRRRQREMEIRGGTYNYSLIVQGQEVGSVAITYLGRQDLMTGEALVFQRTVRQSAVVTGLLAVIAAAALGGVLSRRLALRYDRLTKAAERWGHGKFDTRVDVDGEDELAMLGTTMNRMAERLNEQQVLRRKLTGDISHELRTPLATIQSYLEAFLDGVMPPDEQNVRTVLGESRRLSDLVSHLQELTDAEYRGRSLRIAALDLNSITARETERVRPLFEQKNIELILQPGSPNAAVLADEALFSRIAGNLLVNAYKYTPAGGKVTVAVLSEKERAGFAVSDTGIGISGEHLPHIFERFYRVDPSRSRATGGSGIGLAIAKEGAEAMGGTIEVTSEPGKGSTFRVYLPRP